MFTSASSDKNLFCHAGKADHTSTVPGVISASEHVPTSEPLGCKGKACPTQYQSPMLILIVITVVTCTVILSMALILLILCKYALQRKHRRKAIGDTPTKEEEYDDIISTTTSSLSENQTTSIFNIYATIADIQQVPGVVQLEDNQALVWAWPSSRRKR